MTPSHRERYRQLLSAEFREGLVRAVREQGYYTVLGIENAQVVDGDPHPHLRLELKAHDRFVAISGGLLLDLADVVPDPPPNRYYMPYVGVTPRAQSSDVEHELQHLRDLLDLLEVDADHAANAERLGLLNVGDPTLLAHSIRLEVKKLFWLEVPAFRREYDDSEGIIDIPLAPGKSVKYRCASRDEYVAMWLARYVESLRQMYLERFPTHELQVDAALAAATNECGIDVLGPHPWGVLTEMRDGMNDRIVAQVLAGEDGPAIRQWVLENASDLPGTLAVAPQPKPSRVDRNKEKRRRRARRKGR